VSIFKIAQIKRNPYFYKTVALVNVMREGGMLPLLNEEV